MTTRLDATDRALLALLADDARMPLTGLARSLRIARSTVQQRLARLEAAGVIAGYTIRRGPDSDGDQLVRAHVSLVIDIRRVAAVVAALEAIVEVAELYAVSGSVDLLAVVACPTAARLDEVLDAMARVPGVERTVSSIVLATKFNRSVVR